MTKELRNPNDEHATFGLRHSFLVILIETSIFDNLFAAERTHDVADAYLLAMQKVPVRLRLGAFWS